MPIDELKQIIKTDENILKTLVEEQTGELRPYKGGYICRCPFHDDRNPSFSIYRDSNGEWRYKCFAESCGESGDAISFVQKVEGCDFKEAVRKIAERFSLPYEEEEYRAPRREIRRKEEGAKKEEQITGAPLPFELIADEKLLPEVKEYLRKRYIDPELVKGKIFSLRRTRGTEGYCEDGYLLLVPAINPKREKNKRVVGIKLRNVKGKLPKVKSLKGYKQFPVGLENITPETDTLLIVEGEIDYLTLYSVLKKQGIEDEIAVIGLPSSTYNLTDEIKELFPSRVVIIPDNDESGRKSAENLAKSLFRDREVYIAELPKGIKDINELMESFKGDYEKFFKSLDEIIDVAFVRGTYSPLSLPRNHIALAIAESRDLERAQRRIVPTGVKWIDELLNGGLRRGFYGLAGQPAIGKTSFCLALARHLVNRGIKVLFFSLEMTLEDLTAQLVDWETGIPKYKYLDRKLNDWDIKKLTEALNRPAFNSLVIDDEAQSISDIEERLKVFMNENEGNPAVVFVDYLQRVIPRERRKDVRLEASSVAYDLKRLANDFEVPIIAISSVSREGYSKKENGKNKSKKNPLTAFKESGDIEYSLYAGFFLDYPEEEELSLYPFLQDWHLPIKVVLVKNRFGRARNVKTGEFISRLCYLDFKSGEILDVEEVDNGLVDF